MAELNDRDQIIEFLLGRLGDEQTNALEEQLFADDARFERTQLIEEDLIESYLDSALEDGDRRDFERRYLSSPHLASKVEAVRLAAEVAREVPLAAPQPDSAAPSEEASTTVAPSTDSGFLFGVSPRWALGMAAGLLVVAAAWFGLPSGPSADGPMLVFAGGTTRAEAGVPELTLAAGSQIARLRVELEPGDEASAYRLVLRSGEGREVWNERVSGEALTEGTAASTDVPAERLTAGIYELEVLAAETAVNETLAFYDFRVRVE